MTRRRRLLLVAGSVIATPLLLLLLVFAVAQTGFGKRQIAGLIETLGSSENQRISVDGIGGFLPGAVSLERLAIADRDGVWLKAENVALDWSPLALLGGRLDVERLHAGTVEVVRQPVDSPPRDQPAKDEGSSLPVRIDIDSVSVDRLVLGPALAGEEAVWQLRASARVAGLDEDNQLTIKAQRTDGGDGLIDLEGRYEGAREFLRIKLIAREGAASVGRFAPVEPEGAVDLRADIEGKLDDLGGTLSLKAGDLLNADGKVRAERRDGAVHATLSLTGRAGRLGEAPWAAAVEGGWSLQAKGTIDDASIVIEQASLNAPAGQATLEGRIDRADDTGDLRFTLAAISDRLEGLLPGVSWQGLTAQGRLTGKLMQPDIAATVASEELKVDEIAVGKASMQIDGAWRPAATSAATVKGSLNEIVLPTVEGRSLATSADFSADLKRTEAGVVEISALKVASPLLDVTGRGRFDPASGQAGGTLDANAADLAAFAEAIDMDIAGSLALKLQATPEGDGTALALDATLADGKAPGVPPALIAPQLNASLRGWLGPQQAWRVDDLKLESAAASIAAQGEGRATTGKIAVDWDIADLAAADAALAGRLQGRLTLEGGTDDLSIDGRASLTAAKIGVADVPRLVVELAARRRNGETAGTLAVDGEMQQAPIAGGGDFMVADDGRARIEQFDLTWASLAIVAKNFEIAGAQSTGQMTIKAGKLQDLDPFLPNKIAGSLEAAISASEADKLKVDAKVQGFRLDDSVALDRAQVNAEIADPLGKAEFTATGSASGSKLAGPLHQLAFKASGERAGFSFNVEGSGESLRATAQGKAAIGETATQIDLQSLTATYAGQNASLAAPARIVLEGETTRIEKLSLRAGSGSVAADGVLAPQNSKLDIQGRALPLSLLQAFDPTLKLFGTANFTASLRGALARPEIDLTLDANDLRLRTIRTAGIPAGALRLKAGLRGDAVTFDGRFSAGDGNAFDFSGSGPLPGTGGVTNGSLKIDGGLNLAQLTPFLAGNGQLRGRLTANLTFTASNGAIGGDGEVRIVDGSYFNYAQGVAIRDIDATFGVVGDRLEIRSFTARPRGSGEILLSGGIRVDPELTLPVDIRMVAKNARVIDRRDLQASLSSDLRLNGSVAQGMTLGGTATIERAELNLDASVKGGPDIVDIDVREINRPGGAPDDKKRAPAGPGPEIALDIALKAPQAVFVRGRGLDVEMGGALQIGGTLSRPRVTGGLELRRGTFSGIGRRLEFTRGTVTFPDPDRLDPVIDFTASTKIESGNVEIAITGRPSAPKVDFTSSPPLPQDEIMAQLLFGQSTSSLSPLQLAEIGQSIGSLSGLTGSGGGVLDRLRKALGFDRLGVSSDPNAAAGSSPLSGSSLELGRYVAPGVYLGAKQGATSGSSSAVVEIEVTPNVKVQSEIGADANSKIGIGLEWDY